MFFIGVDIGGTFTDIVVMDETGNVTTEKAPTTPGRLEDGVIDALNLVARLRALSVEDMLADTSFFGHGTTQATNALIERKGARTGLITTRGFGDTLLIQRLLGFTAGVPEEKFGHYSRRRYPDPIVPRRLIREVPERVDQAGRVLLPLDESATYPAVEELLEAGIEALAICLLWSFRYPAHEARIAEIARELSPRLFVTVSHQVAPVIGEYERTATTVLNSYLGPIVSQYVEALEVKLRQRGLRGVFTILNSIGGVMAAGEAAQRAVLLLASGPTGGVIGSRFLAEALGHRNVITTDMGGTSFDVGLIMDSRPMIAGVSEVGSYHVLTPMVEITAVGAGGGSIASVRDGQLLVGPESAGARPGPVCYARGGDRATVTDADVVLGIIDPDAFLAGRMKLDRAAAETAIGEQIAEPLGLSVDEAAAAIRTVVDAKMANTLRELTIKRGHDPRDFVLYAYGGAGPSHCAGFGPELQVPLTVVPATSMVHSAYGALASDIHHSAEQSYILRSGGGDRPLWDGLDPQVLEQQFARLEERCLQALAHNGIAGDRAELARSLDMRYRRQTHELIIPVPEPGISAEVVRALVDRFERAYEDAYGRGAGFREAGIEITTFRVDAIGRTVKPRLGQHTTNGHRSGQCERLIFLPERGERAPVRVFQWLELRPRQSIDGPAVVEHPETTVFIGPEQTASMDSYGNLVIEKRQA